MTDSEIKEAEAFITEIEEKITEAERQYKKYRRSQKPKERYYASNLFKSIRKLKQSKAELTFIVAKAKIPAVMKEKHRESQIQDAENRSRYDSMRTKQLTGGTQNEHP